MSPSQDALWLLSQLTDCGSSYALPLGVRLAGELDTVSLAAACRAVVERHLPLVSVVARSEDGGWVNRARRVALHMATHDVSGFDHDEVEQARAAIYRDACRRPVDLCRGPMVAFHLIREPARRSTLFAVPHHYAFDGPSKAVFADEVARCYGHLVEGLAPRLTVRRFSYADHARAARGRADAAVARLRRDAQALGPLHLAAHILPLDRPRPSSPSADGGSVAFRVSGQQLKRLKAVAARQGATMFQVLAAAMGALLHVYGNRHHVTVTVVIGTRGEGDDALVGHFSNNLPLGLDVSDDPEFGHLLARVRDQVAHLSALRDVPLHRVVEVVRPPRSPGLQPLFQVGLAYQREGPPPPAFPGLESEWEMFLPNHGAKCELLVQALRRTDSIEARLEYATAVFDQSTAERIVGHLQSLLSAVAADPRRRLSSVHEVASDGVSSGRSGIWSLASADVASEMVHEAFERQARRTPGMVAVVCGDDECTYAELEARSRRLATRLRSVSVGPETVVGVCLPRSVDLVVALMGVLRAGGAYLPLDPDQPAARLNAIVADAQPAAIVARRAGGGFATRLVVLMDEDPAPAQPPAPMAPVTVDPGNLAYVVYTSGSTGTPKGVMVEHRNLANLVSSMRAAPGLGPRDVVVATSSVGFDIAALEIFGPLSCGARVVVSPHQGRIDGALLAALIGDAGATIVQATPSLWRVLVDSGWSPRQRVQAWCGGEALPRQLAARLLKLGVDLWNLYGPTETTVWSAVGRVTAPDADDGPGPGPLGNPVSSTTLYVLDAALEPLPAGVPGELHIAGAGVARGYLGRPALTAERFVADPVAADGGRLYRTGDVVRRRPDGRLDFLGRTDDQVKLRGVRVELAEAEAALASHPDVRGAAVVVDSDGCAPRLVAYVLAGPSGPPTRELRAHMRRLVPDAMVPAVFVALDAFPLTPNGKLDRHALPPVAGTGTEECAPFVAAGNPAEAGLARIWADVLGVERVGADDDFFDLGGHSLSAVEIAARARSSGIPLSANQVFEHPTVSQLAAASPRVAPLPPSATVSGPFALLSDEERAAERPAVRGLDDAYPLSPVQHGLLFHTLLERRSGVYVEQRAWLLEGHLDPEAFVHAWQQAVDRHPMLRTSVAWAGLARPLQLVASAATVPVIELDWPQRSAPQERRRLAEYLNADAEAGFDLRRPPLLRLTLISTGRRRHWVVWSFHHIILDGWSETKLLDEVTALYGHERSGSTGEVALIERMLYRHYIEWLEKRDRGGEEAFWRARLGSVHEGTTLSTTLPVTGGPAYGAEECVLTSPATESITRFARRHQLTLATLVQGAWAVVLAGRVGREDVTFGATGAGRPAELPRAASVLGPCITTLPVPVRLSPDERAVAWLREIQCCHLDLRRFEHAPLADIHRWSGLATGGTLFDTVVVVQTHTQRPDHRWPGLQVARKLVQGRSSYAFTLVIRPGPALVARALYDRSRLDSDDVRSLLLEFTATLKAFVSHPISPLRDLGRGPGPGPMW